MSDNPFTTSGRKENEWVANDAIASTPRDGVVAPVGIPAGAVIRKREALERFRRRYAAIASWLMFVFCAVGSYWGFSEYVVSTVVVRGRSMDPTLRDGDHYLLNRLAYVAKDPKRGDVVVLRDPGHSDMAVKRIVGMPFETVTIREGWVFINGKKLQETYISSGILTRVEAHAPSQFELGKDEYFMLGDNRDSSEDSRYYGPIHRRSIMGALAH